MDIILYHTKSGHTNNGTSCSVIRYQSLLPMILILLLLLLLRWLLLLQSLSLSLSLLLSVAVCCCRCRYAVAVAAVIDRIRLTDSGQRQSDDSSRVRCW